MAASVDHVLPRRLLVPGSRDSEETTKARVFVRGWVVGIVFGTVQAVQYSQEGLWGQMGLNAGVAVLGVVLLFCMRLGAPLALIVHLSMGAPALAFALGSVAQTPFDVTSVFYLVIVPLLSSFVLGARAAIGWTGVSLALGFTALWLGLNGHTLDQVDHHLWQTQVMNFAFIIVLVAVVSIGVHQLRMRAYRELDLASRAKSAFLANMSHEIRTPMNGVLGLTEVMLSEPLPAHQRERLELIRRSGEVLVALINDVLDVSRVEAGKLSLDLVEVDLAALARDVQALYMGAAEQKTVALVLDLAPGVPRCVRADPTRLRQVLTNLVGNSVKFTSSGRVRLAIEPAADGLRFSVDDTGVGIAADVLPRLFRPFEQGDSSTTRRFGGSGLGLALSYKLVGLMGGTLSATSQLNIGTHFEFTLVLERLTPTQETAVVVSVPRGTGRVLVVDDNPINLKVASSLVEKLGYSCATAVNGREAFERVQQEPFDLVLMDCHMPEMDGFQATRHIRALPGPVAQLPVLALTASTMPEDREACRAAGMNELLAKPLSRERLGEALARFLSGARKAM
jgi:signal transduction histidine kinase/CheY-like chemotaxis protein